MTESKKYLACIMVSKYNLKPTYGNEMRSNLIEKTFDTVSEAKVFINSFNYNKEHIDSVDLYINPVINGEINMDINFY
jgi:hypothetical protein